MPRIQIPPYEELQRLFDLLRSKNPDLVPGCRWLLFGPELASIVLPKEDEPTLNELVTLLRLLRDQAPNLRTVGEKLAHNSEHDEDAIVELCVDQLLEHPNWEHPTQVLERPRPDFTKLLSACEARLENATDSEQETVAGMTAKVERAVRIAESARRRREIVRRGRKRKRP